VLALLAAACGSPSSSSTSSTTTSTPLTGFAAQSASAILASGCGATLPVSSVMVQSSFARPALVGGLRTMTWSMSTAADAGTLRYGAKESVQVVVLPFITYVKAPAAWWQATTASGAAAALANQWISIAQTSSSAAIATPLIASGNLSATLANCQPSGQSVTKAGLGQVDGVATIDVKVQAGFTTQYFSVPTETVPYIAKSVYLAGSPVQRETSLLSGFNRQRPITAPAGATPIETAAAG
jgi:hypothetical protein